MSQWTDLRDGALDAMKQGALNVVEETKQKFLQNFVEAGEPVIESYADLFVNTVKAQAENESGWNKVRDAVVIPFAVKIGLYVGKELIDFVMSKTSTQNTAQA